MNTLRHPAIMTRLGGSRFHGLLRRPVDLRRPVEAVLNRGWARSRGFAVSRSIRLRPPAKVTPPRVGPTRVSCFATLAPRHAHYHFRTPDTQDDDDTYTDPHPVIELSLSPEVEPDSPKPSPHIISATGYHEESDTFSTDKPADKSKEENTEPTDAEIDQVLDDPIESLAESSTALSVLRPLEKNGPQQPNTDQKYTQNANQTADQATHARHRRPRDAAAPPTWYVHHFDSFTLVRHLQEDGHFTKQQAIVSMKAVRTLLAKHMILAQRTLSNKNDSENESYLFRAACSELHTEIRNSRRVADEQIRQERIHLQQEVDALTQTMTQELAKLTDTIRGLFNDRSMAMREEQKQTESTVQKLNYKIAVLLGSDTKSDIEALRWVLVRRAMLGLLALGAVILTLLQTSVRRRRRNEQAARELREQESQREEAARQDELEQRRRSQVSVLVGDVLVGGDEGFLRTN